jgi:hypothetical protein
MQAERYIWPSGLDGDSVPELLDNEVQILKYLHLITARKARAMRVVL